MTKRVELYAVRVTLQLKKKKKKGQGSNTAGSNFYICESSAFLEITWTSELGSTVWRLNQFSFPLYLHRSSFRMDTLPKRESNTNPHTHVKNQHIHRDEKIYLLVLLNVTHQQVGPFGKHSWHKHRRINTEMGVGSQSRSPLRRKGCKRERSKLANKVISFGRKGNKREWV